MRFSRNFSVISPKFPANYETKQGVYTCSDTKSLFAGFIMFHGKLNEVAFKLHSAGCTLTANITPLFLCQHADWLRAGQLKTIEFKKLKLSAES